MRTQGVPARSMAPEIATPPDFHHCCSASSRARFFDAGSLVCRKPNEDRKGSKSLMAADARPAGEMRQVQRLRLMVHGSHLRGEAAGNHAHYAHFSTGGPLTRGGAAFVESIPRSILWEVRDVVCLRRARQESRKAPGSASLQRRALPRPSGEERAVHSGNRLPRFAFLPF